MHELGDNGEAVVESRRVLADVGGDDVLEVGVLLDTEAAENGVADGVDLSRLEDGEFVVERDLLRLGVSVHCLRYIFFLQGGEEEVNVGSVLDLVQEQVHIGEELFRSVIVEDVHVHTLRPACGKGCSVFLCFNEVSNTSENHCTREDGLEIAARHLEDNAHPRWHGCYKPCTTLDASAPLVVLWVICRHVEICGMVLVGCP